MCILIGYFKLNVDVFSIKKGFCGGHHVGEWLKKDLAFKPWKNFLNGTSEIRLVSHHCDSFKPAQQAPK